ncbi:zinc-finger domain-containing protein [Reyranella sp. CPCC 100927]|uniref:zinc-finger domain-containing protein n=1 Tax=Reyranella sp. CPCC 100927 TaxID=2599616 RepID=UPI0011B53237|nr:zinc-finger domain-containing protein [Reyranella sp. CPCC 100927]TWT13714.1 zinc-finger domain-containing protein [Reyranella sp. CPCC 100927]
MASPYPKFRNDNAAAEIRIGARAFHCIGVTPPHDHPHVYINMGEQDVILCPYCGTSFRFDSRLGPFAADPGDASYGDV